MKQTLGHKTAEESSEAGSERPGAVPASLDCVSTDGTFYGSHLRWPADRSRRTFVVRVVEPGKYAPEDHGQLFSAVVIELVSPAQAPVDPLSKGFPRPAPQRFDLVTFPEAFAAPATLLPMLQAITEVGPTGCIHVGLRPTESAQHLFDTDGLRKFVGDLAGLSSTVAADLRDFRLWLCDQPSGRHFNIGCLFMVDATGELRVCLHPKMVRSKFESSPLPENHMDESDLLTLVTLVPVDKRLLSVTLQPLICSDAVDLPTDRQNVSPMQAIKQHAGCFGDNLPGHVDVVSVVSCTPQPQGETRDGRPFRAWNEKFQNAFTGAAQGPSYDRHHFAAIVLSNFHTLADAVPGGLSGIFMPVPPRKGDFPVNVAISCFGRTKQMLRNNWSTPDDHALDTWSNQGFVAGIDPFAPPPDALLKILGFTIQRLPRDNSRWDQPESITQLNVQVGRFDEAGTVKFASEDYRHAE